MRSKFTRGLPAVAVMFLAVVTMAGGVHWAQSSLSNPSGQERKKRNLKDEVLTVIDAAPEEVDAEKKAKRIQKNKRFNVESKLPYSLEEQKDGEYSGTLLESEPPPLPITSDLIIVGSIQRRQPYLSENITKVYTELLIHIEEILKNNKTRPVYTFEPLLVYREGGAIRMPSGRVFRYMVAHLGIPEVGKRYVLFLKREAAGDYKIVSGYELTDKTIIPLETFSDRDPLLDLKEPQFLELLRQKISQSQAEQEGH